MIASLRGADVKRPRRMAPYVLLAVIATLISYMSHESGLRWSQALDNFGIDQGFLARGEMTPEIVKQLPQTRDFIFVELNTVLPRPVLAALIHQLRYAKVVALDLMLANRESEIAVEDRDSPTWKPIIRYWRIEDAAVARAMKKANNVIVGTWPERLPITEMANAPLPVRQAGDDDKRMSALVHMQDLPVVWKRPPDNIWNAARWHGHVRVEPGQDGIVRRIRLEENTPLSSEPIPSLSLAVARAHGILKPDSTIENGEDGALINYLGGMHLFGDDQRIILSRVLNDTEAEDFRGLTVFVGQTNYSSKDVFATPFGDIPGVQIQAQAAATWVTPNGGFNHASPTLNILASLILSLLVLAPLMRWPFWSATVSAALLVVGTILGAWTLFARCAFIVPLGVPFIAIALTYNGAGLIEIRRVRATLGRFIGEEMVAQTLHPLSSLELGGRTEVATAFFCDLRGYSRLSESLSPERAASLLKEYTTTLTRVVESHGGRPIDYLGDGVFVLFEERHTNQDQVMAAIKAGIDAQAAFSVLDDRWGDLASPNGEPLEAAIAIHTGEMLIGLVGDENHLKPGAVGDAVNVAAHAQSYSRQCGHRILITRDTLDAMSETDLATVQVIRCGEFQFKGRQTLVELFGIEPSATHTSRLVTVANKG